MQSGLKGFAALSFGRRQPSRLGFTLIELLVVVAIIALLVSILVPTLSEARKVALRAVCASNLHQLYVGTMTFAHDHENALLYVPLDGWPNGWFRWDGGQVQLIRSSEHDPTFMPYFTNTREVFYCPANPVRPETAYPWPGWPGDMAWAAGPYLDGSSGNPTTWWTKITYMRLFNLWDVNEDVYGQEPTPQAHKITDLPHLGLWADLNRWTDLYGWVHANHPGMWYLRSEQGRPPEGRNLCKLNGSVTWSEFTEEMKYQFLGSTTMGGEYISY